MTRRLPFDPDRIKQGKRAGPGGEQPPGLVVRPGDGDADAPWTITQLAARIDTSLKVGVPGRIRVVGEVSSVSNRTHWYFSLKDEGAVISAVVFASTAKKLSAEPVQGDRVIASGRLDFYAPSGRVSLIVDRIEPVGQGSLERELKARLEALRKRGWLDPDTKIAPPPLPRRIAVITSKDGAAVHDVIDTARRRCPMVGLLVVDVRVQGERAAGEIAGAIRAISDRADALGIDAMLVTRGGGSLEDLWAFNELEVSDAIHHSAIPVVAAIGHETDVTLAELVADRRAATPTQAAMRMLPDADALDEQLAALQGGLRAIVLGMVRERSAILARLAKSPAIRDPGRGLSIHRDRLGALVRAVGTSARSRLLESERRLHRASARLERHRPAAVHARREEHVRALHDRLNRAIRDRAQRACDGLDALHRELHAVGPMQVLSRGYSVTTDANGRVIREATDAVPGDELTTRLVGSSLRSRVVGDAPDADPAPKTPEPVEPQPSPQPSPPPRRGRRSKRGGRATPNPDQMDLF